VKTDGYWFESDLFHPEPGEDEATNPGVYGKQLAHWLAQRLQAHGYASTEVIPEDWGWSVVCARKPLLLWVGCGSLASEGISGEPSIEPAGTTRTWHCFPEAEVPFWKRVLRQVDTAPQLERLQSDLNAILSGEPELRLVEEA